MGSPVRRSPHPPGRRSEGHPLGPPAEPYPPPRSVSSLSCPRVSGKGLLSLLLTPLLPTLTGGLRMHVQGSMFMHGFLVYGTVGVTCRSDPCDQRMPA